MKYSKIKIENFAFNSLIREFDKKLFYFLNITQRDVDVMNYVFKFKIFLIKT